MLIQEKDITPQLAAELDSLLRACFDGLRFHDTPPADARAIWVEDVIVGHAAVAVRPLILRGAPVRAALLGMVCAAPSWRGRGIAQALIQELHRAVPLPFVLNCGSALTGFYAQLGYVRLSNAAAYDRGGRVEVDDDPVMGCANGIPLVLSFQEGPIHLGIDF